MNVVLVRGLVLRWIRRHRLRSALAVAAVALGVAVYLASVAVTRSVVATAAAATSRIAGGADLVVEAEGTGLPPDALATVQARPGVTAAAPVVSGWLRLADVAGRRVLVVGIDVAAEARMRRGPGTRPGAPRFEVVDAAAFLSGAPTAVVSRPLAAELGVAGGGRISLQGANGVVRLPVGGVADPPGGADGPAARSVVVPLRVAGTLLGRGGRVDRIDVTVQPGASPEAVAQGLRTALGDPAGTRIRVAPPGSTDPATGQVLGIVDVALKIGALVSLLVGVFLVHHTVAVGVAERTREVGIFRALGATRRQVVLVFCTEAIFLGVVGAALGTLLGLVVARTSLDAVAGTISGAYFPAEAAPIELPAAYLVSGIVAGAAVALVAAWRPARRAASVAPNDAIRRGPDESSRAEPVVRPRVVTALALLAAAGVCAAVTFPRAGWISGFLLLGGFLTAAPMLLVAGARAVAPALRRLAGVPGRLAAEELSRHPRRAALPAATLAIGLALVIETMGNARSLEGAMTGWLDEHVAGDLFVSSGTTALSVSHTPLEASLAADVAAVPGVATLTAVRFIRAPWRDTRVFLLGIDIAPYRRMARVSIRGAGTRDEILARVQTGRECLVSENFSALHGVGIGDTVEIPASEGTVPLRVAGIYPDYSWPRGSVFLDRSVLVSRLGDALADEFSVKLAPGADRDEVARAIEARIGAGRELVVVDAAQFRAAAGRLIDDFFALSYAQVAASLAVAFLAVFNSLWIAVVMRRRELALFRAVGATRGQLVAAVVLQAATMGAIGGALGLVGGLAVEWLSVKRVIFEDTGWTFPCVVPWGPVAATLALGVVTSALAGVVPARSAARTEIRDALGAE